MGINARSGGAKKELVPPGNYLARCYSMVHVGTNEESYSGEPKMVNKVRITWELPTELRVFKEENGEQPMVISKPFTISLHEKSKLRPFLESWRGKGFTTEEAKNFDITRLIGVAGMLNVIHRTKDDGTIYADVSAISPIPKGLSCPAQINDSFIFDYEENYSDAKIESLASFIKDKIKTSVEYCKRNGTYVDLPPTEHAVDAIPEDNGTDQDLPF